MVGKAVRLAGEVNMPQVDNERGQNEKQIERYSEMQK